MAERMLGENEIQVGQGIQGGYGIRPYDILY